MHKPVTGRHPIFWSRAAQAGLHPRQPSGIQVTQFCTVGPLFTLHIGGIPKDKTTAAGCTAPAPLCHLHDVQGTVRESWDAAAPQQAGEEIRLLSYLQEL